MPLSKPRAPHDPDDPQFLSVQLQIRLPFWYKRQLQAEAASLGVTLPALVADAVERVYKPVPPA